jgi:hypothetical protein
MPRTTTKSKKEPANKTSKRRVAANEAPRVLERPSYKSFRLSKRLKHPGPKLPSSFKLIRRAASHIWRHKKLFAVIALVYLALNLLLVRGFLFTADIGEVKTAISELFTGSVGQIAGSLTVMGLLVGSLSPASEVAGLYQSILVLVFSMFIIWTLRQTYAGELPRLREVFYKSSYPLVQFVIVIFIIGLQLIPLLLANFLYTAAIASGITTTFAEVFAVSAIAFLLALWSLYMVTVSVFAMYIVTLPDMTPLKAVRSAKGLVHHRRWTVMRKILFLPFALGVMGLVVMIPIILIASSAAEVIFLVLSAFILPFVHSYVYALYRELLA